MVSTSNIAKILLSLLQASPYLFLGIAIASGISLFAPIIILESLGIIDLVANHRSIIGLTFLISISILLSTIIANGVKLIKPALIESWNVSQYKKELFALSLPEKKILAQYVQGNTTTLPQSIRDGVVGGLVGKKILYWSSNISHPSYGDILFDCNIQPWAWKKLNQCPKLINIVDSNENEIKPTFLIISLGKLNAHSLLSQTYLKRLYC